jgi:alpha-galactosidase
VADGTYRVTAGLNDWEFYKDLAPGEAVESAHVAIAVGKDPTLNDVSAQFVAVGRRHWYPHAPRTVHLPVEWNHWWGYEDRSVNEEVFLKNVEIAATIGVELCTLDASWFGPGDPTSDWYAYRGAWDSIHTARFPRGLRPLADRVHALGMKFGLWCEVEALGSRSRLAETHPEFAAERAGERLGYVCLGNPAARDWAYETLVRLVTQHDADWIKLDFNLDPGAGCDRTDHGHGAGDGLYEHYLGLYETLGRFRRSHPDVVLESCSSGGLRVDLGMLRQTHLTFLSDPDWPEHSLQVFWGASTFLAPEVLLHWSFSPWLHEHPHQRFDPSDPALTERRLDFYLRVAMLHAFGFSQRLPDLPDWIRRRLAFHARLYRKLVRQYISSARMYRLSDHPVGTWQDQRWVAFQYAMPGGDEHLVFVFRLRGAGGEARVRLAALQPDATYELDSIDEQSVELSSGLELTRDGLDMRGLAAEESALIVLRKVRKGIAPPAHSPRR